VSSLHKLGGMPPIHLSEQILSEITRLGLSRYPVEACGVLLPAPFRGSSVIELPNRSLQPQDEYIIWPDDIEVAIGDWAHSVDELARNSVAVWHTHPRGNIGPSRGDMRKRLTGVAYLVVSLDIDGRTATPTWF
jgi:proteasome lid subunit RPN8/RPN11